jgi:hypothetical protein
MIELFIAGFEDGRHVVSLSNDMLSSRYGGDGLLHKLLDKLFSNEARASCILFMGKQLYLFKIKKLV